MTFEECKQKALELRTSSELLQFIKDNNKFIGKDVDICNKLNFLVREEASEEEQDGWHIEKW